MGLTVFDSVHWGLTACVELLVLLFALRHGFLKRLPIFSSYLCLLVANEIIAFVTYSATGIRSRISFDVYWTMQALQVSMRALVVYEACRELLAPYAGVWRLCRPFLIGVAAILFSTAALVASRNAHPLAETILTGERGLELTVVSVLLFGLLFCHYYGMAVRGPLLWIALGLGAYSAIQIGNNTFLEHWLSYFSLWENLRRFSFDIALGFWMVAVWKAFPARQPAPVLLQRSDYEVLQPQVATRLRELNARLLEMWK